MEKQKFKDLVQEYGDAVITYRSTNSRKLKYNVCTLDFDNKESENDKVFENNNIKIVVEKKSYLYLVGTTLDYSGGLNGKGFVFINPNADRTCGCGESFSI